MKELHDTQRALLELLKNNITDPLTIRELKDELGVSSTSVVYHHIRQLEKKGFLKRNPSNPHDYHVVEGGEKQIVYLNLYGMAQCGPNGTILDGNPVDRIPIASRLIKFPTGDAFLLEAKGDSMEPKIKEGDLVIVRKSRMAESKDTVVCVYDGEVMIKKLHKEGNQVILQSENAAKYTPILAKERQLIIEGIVKGVLQYN